MGLEPGVECVAQCVQKPYQISHASSALFQEYQGVKEFHMLDRIGCYCKLMNIRPQNMVQNSNSPLSSTKSMVAMHNQW